MSIIYLLPTAEDLRIRDFLTNQNQNDIRRVVESKQKVDELRKKVRKYGSTPSFVRNLDFRRIDMLQKQVQGKSTRLQKAKRNVLNARITSLKLRNSLKKARKMRQIAFDIRNNVRSFKEDTEHNCNMIKYIRKNNDFMQLRKQDAEKTLKIANQNLQIACKKCIQTREYLQEYNNIFLAV
jgi:hypothetical protein